MDCDDETGTSRLINVSQWEYSPGEVTGVGGASALLVAALVVVVISLFALAYNS